MTAALAVVPQPYKAMLLLFLNCGMRTVDVDNLRKSDIKGDRLIWQRKKKEQSEYAPVISYPLWPKTLEAIKESMKLRDGGDFVFCDKRGQRFVQEKFNKDGKPSVHDNLNRYWRERSPWNGKEMSQLQATGATFIHKLNPAVKPMYLAHTLKSMADIHYTFHDGEVFEPLDDAVEALGVHFGLVEAKPKQTVTLSPEVLAKLAEKGMTLEQVLAAL